MHDIFPLETWNVLPFMYLISIKKGILLEKETFSGEF